ncbi:hypothetical protein LEP1GSC049_1915 [Leptospira kirschneri serovar Cynopteri str. 3522 CT]|uniref:Uncharacterized protein n=1 Tax=Leptospira kirschneri serovar Bulgarica str. Nikolaevo TaxID=1240687 RepID=M6FGL2_9LEPT|nr:hypothetical protein LEP1GSC044_2683 [Leptospira kirschneri serovar Grippotyphosa str. RM52]EKQ82781.1 hypothetical protein LEP1GSC064_2197 [Leptospira kirschneri serovar Grippotyphosa str. Moskva]EKR07552.1 hypothetical protein LEP1GSC122_2824 [Leptospira kirschneri serovar Valbuzzi str. 200702274]EMJ93460.1 hypothetical protein LEP1GSC198_0170 [Leptospira kirschneri str. JB]EMK15720.1 hypothetical protein LEP1GSC042_0057 [Leptospira kirschneri serovar Bim str. PUO 1247]EMK25239.1 hypothet
MIELKLIFFDSQKLFLRKALKNKKKLRFSSLFFKIRIWI